MSSSLGLSTRKKESSRGSLTLDEERNIFGKIYHSVKDKRRHHNHGDTQSLSPSPSVEMEHDAFMKEEGATRKRDPSSKPVLSVSALKKLEAMYDREDRSPPSSPPSSPPLLASMVDTSSSAMARIDSLRSLPNFHVKRRLPKVSKETSHKEFLVKRDMSVKDLVQRNERETRRAEGGGGGEGRSIKASSSSISSSSSSSATPLVHGKRDRAASNPKSVDVESTRKHMEKITRFEHTRKFNMGKIQSKLNSTPPVIVSSRLPSTLLPSLTLSRPAKWRAEEWSTSRPSSPALMPRSPRSPRGERKGNPHSGVSTSVVNISSTNNIITTAHKTSNSTTNVQHVHDNNSAIKPHTDNTIQYSITTTSDNIIISPNRWSAGQSSMNTLEIELDGAVERKRAHSHDNKRSPSKEFSVSGHRDLSIDLSDLHARIRV